LFHDLATRRARGGFVVPSARAVYDARDDAPNCKFRSGAIKRKPRAVSPALRRGVRNRWRIVFAVAVLAR